VATLAKGILTSHLQPSYFILTTENSLSTVNVVEGMPGYGLPNIFPAWQGWLSDYPMDKRLPANLRSVNGVSSKKTSFVIVIFI